MALPKLTDQRQCRARCKQTQSRCKQWAILGGFVCRFHGGNIKRVKAAAKRRLTIVAIDDLRIALETGNPRLARRAEQTLAKLQVKSHDNIPPIKDEMDDGNARKPADLHGTA